MAVQHLRIKNAAELRAAFGAAPGLMSRKMRIALYKAGLVVMRESMSRTPVRTGRLKTSHFLTGSGGVKVSGMGKKMQAEVGPNTDYAGFVHNGTRFQRAQPFLKKGADAAENKVNRIIKDDLQDVLNNIARRT